jgi:hypothetical protein
MSFTGLAVYDSGVFNELAEDVSDEIGMISPFETPLLDFLAQPQYPAENVLHEWLSEELGPNTLSVSVTQDDAATYIVPHMSGTAAYPYLQVGMVVENESTGEQMQISAIGVNTVTITRGFGGSTAATLTAGQSLFVLGDAALEGADVAGDISRPRTRVTNYCQIFKKDILVSGTMQAVKKLGGISDEYDHQRGQRLRESIRDLEKTVIRGRLSGNTIGGSAVANTRTMRGLWQSIATNATSTGTLTPEILDTVIQGAWSQGASDLNMIVADKVMKRIIDGWNSSRIEVQQGMAGDTKYQRKVTYYEGTFGDMQVQLNRWMPTGSLMVISGGRVHVVPLAGRSFAHVPVSRTGDSQKGMVIGEYTLEVKNEEGMAKAFGCS